ncbi:OLC1v1036967C1 [Oldenlandia corymbosa var. corymbosa]|uniref:OLC1v1036967C1 n=1 Tax=Oldenlandia corymbosa var. corymbosa TaxID=529605 RepID=A0AAV1D082_OLDCO|nr:OLC1v1036967C1 [Oldenlandia corymbosa var. corymbosa]
MATAKMSRGRQRVDMVKMTNENNLQVTFSKRRLGLFKKASELCTLTGSELAIVVFSPGSKVYSFGSPSVSKILEKYEAQVPHFIGPQSSIDKVNQARCRANEISLNEELRALEDHMGTVKKRRSEFTKMVRANQNQYWWQAPIEELSMEQLEQLKIAYEEMDKRVQIQTQKGLPPNANSFSDFNIPEPNNHNNDSVAYEPQPPPSLPQNIHYPPMPSGSSFADLILSNESILVENGPSFTTNQGSSRSGADDLSFPFAYPNTTT